MGDCNDASRVLAETNDVERTRFFLLRLDPKVEIADDVSSNFDDLCSMGVFGFKIELGLCEMFDKLII